MWHLIASSPAVKGDNSGIGAAAAAYFVDLGMKPGDKVYVYEGDTSSVTSLRDQGFTDYLTGAVEYDGKTIIVSRTGYTGEDGFEIYGSHAYIRAAWDKLVESGRCKPCGLGCRDTLRFEVGLPLYGDELSAEISPVEAGLGMFCKLDKDFIGRDALLEQKTNGVARRVIGIELEGRAVPRHGYPVLHDGVQVGEVTTGYNSISTGKSVCMALVETPHAKLGTPLEVQIRKKTFPGVVVKKRFYDKHYKK